MRSVFVVLGRGALAVAVATSAAGCSITLKAPGRASTTTTQLAPSVRATQPPARPTTARVTVATRTTVVTHRAATPHATAKATRSRRTVPVSVGPPPFPGPYFHPGDVSPTIKIFQDEMHDRGYFPLGTGDYGPNTLAMVKRLQAQNGLIPNGEIGPNTWRLAWTGTYNPDETVPSAPADFSCTISQDPTTLVTTYLLSGPATYSGGLTIRFYDSYGDQFDPEYLDAGSALTGVLRYAPTSTTSLYASPTYCTAN